MGIGIVKNNKTKLSLKKIKDKHIDLYSLKINGRGIFQIQVIEDMLLLYELTPEIHWPKVLWLPKK